MSSLREIFNETAKAKNVSPAFLKETLEAAVLAAYKRDPNVTQNAEVELDLDTGKYIVWAHREIVEDIEEPLEQITLEEARQIRPDAQLWETIASDVTPKDFGRLAAQAAKQVLNQKLREAQRKVDYDEYKKKEGVSLIGIVQRVEGRNVIVNLGKIEALLPGSEQIHGERPRVGERLKVFVLEVRDTPRGVQVIVSRGTPRLVLELFELEVPEVLDGTVIIENIAREAGHRTKVAVRSRDAHIDPIGACVGARGSRIQGISAELRNEKIEIIRFDPVLERYIENSLSPARVKEVRVYEEYQQALVIVPDSMLSLAIGREGQNVRLASKLTGYRIDIKSESQLADLERQMQEDEAAAAWAAEEAQGLEPGEASPEAPAQPEPAAEEPAPEVAAEPETSEAVAEEATA